MVPHGEQVLLSQPVVEDTEQPQAWCKESNNGQQSPDGREKSPHDDNNGLFDAKEYLLSLHALPMEPKTCLYAPCYRQTKIQAFKRGFKGDFMNETGFGILCQQQL